MKQIFCYALNNKTNNISIYIFLPRSATTTWSHCWQILLDASLYCSRERPTARVLDMAPPDTSEKMEAKAGEGSKENQDPQPHLPDLSSEPPAVVTTPSATAWTTRRWRGCRAWPWPGASVTSSATSASPSPSASPSTSRTSHSTPFTPWWVIPNIVNFLRSFDTSRLHR